MQNQISEAQQKGSDCEQTYPIATKRKYSDDKANT
jgi:hypothetical protein